MADSPTIVMKRSQMLIITDNLPFGDTIKLSIISFDRLCISQFY